MGLTSSHEPPSTATALSAAEDPSNITAESDSEEPEEESDLSDDSDDSEGWITPGNVDSKDHSLDKKRKGGAESAEVESFDVAIMTGDTAVQNVALQLGLNVIGVGGKRIKDIRTWVLRCHGCFKITKETTKVFCPSCGGNTLLRTSITYVTPSPKHPQGYVLHLKRNYQYRLRGIQYSLPTPKGGRAENIILREDQKEFQRGVKKENIRKKKEEKARDRGDLDETEWVFGGEKKWNSTAGMPVVGYGRKNPNEAKKRRR
ncbi:hypothetical protein BT69DRAFT_1332331 [Atractiella rhizophila]|nr:hypothetical protein BT69DRAFT_1332331 [Atractiella rhizophila]